MSADQPDAGRRSSPTYPLDNVLPCGPLPSPASSPSSHTAGHNNSPSALQTNQGVNNIDNTLTGHSDPLYNTPVYAAAADTWPFVQWPPFTSDLSSTAQLESSPDVPLMQQLTSLMYLPTWTPLNSSPTASAVSSCDTPITEAPPAASSSPPEEEFDIEALLNSSAFSDFTSVPQQPTPQNTSLAAYNMTMDGLQQPAVMQSEPANIAPPPIERNETSPAPYKPRLTEAERLRRQRARNRDGARKWREKQKSDLERYKSEVLGLHARLRQQELVNRTLQKQLHISEYNNQRLLQKLWNPSAPLHRAPRAPGSGSSSSSSAPFLSALPHMHFPPTPLQTMGLGLSDMRRHSSTSIDLGSTAALRGI